VSSCSSMTARYADSMSSAFSCHEVPHFVGMASTLSDASQNEWKSAGEPRRVSATNSPTRVRQHTMPQFTQSTLHRSSRQAQQGRDLVLGRGGFLRRRSCVHRVRMRRLSGESQTGSTS